MPLIELLTRPKLWTGRLRDRDGEWFLAWAPDAAEAARFAVATLGDPVPGSIREVKDPTGTCVAFRGPGYHPTRLVPNLALEREVGPVTAAAGPVSAAAAPTAPPAPR